MAGPNLLIGYGETLTHSIPRKSGSSSRSYPYSIEQARARLHPQLVALISDVEVLPVEAKPKDEGVGLVTVHPAFLAKTGMPGNVFKKAGLRTLGSRPIRIKPERDARKRTPKGLQLAAQLYLSGKISSFQRFVDLLLSDKTSAALQSEFCRIERIDIFRSKDKLLSINSTAPLVPVEMILHGHPEDDSLLDSFVKFASTCQVELDLPKRFAVPGLIFIPAIAPQEGIDRVASFSALRAVRQLPSLRINLPALRQRVDSPPPTLPEIDALNPGTKVAVFDGGIGVQDFSRWCEEHIPPELASSHADYLTHGTEVTSALLFGSIEPAQKELPRPYFRVEHYRVIGSSNEQDVDLYDCMHKINAILKSGEIRFANISVGPRLAVDDGQPHPWTCMLDSHLASGDTFITVAVGNDGEIAGDLGRIQPPADAVNALAVGAADSPHFLWNRARYSCRGPGRSPGLVKPDGLVFSGTASSALVLYSPYAAGLSGVQGTSYGSPLALRVAASAFALSETKLSATALRALMVHRAERSTAHDIQDVGWGRFPSSVEELLTCANNEATVLYQGHLMAGKPIRAKLPLPAVPLGTNISIKATFCFASQVDPADPINYTRHGLTVTFRPKGEGTSYPFFSTENYDSEEDLRRDAAKWETMLHRADIFRAEDLLGACVDIEHGARSHGRSVKNKEEPPLPYVLLVTITADTAQPIYDQVLQRHRTLQPIQLRERIEL